MHKNSKRGAINQIKAAAYSGISVRSLQYMHERGEGPKRYKVGLRTWAYKYDDLDEWLEERTKRFG